MPQSSCRSLLFFFSDIVIIKAYLNKVSAMTEDEKTQLYIEKKEARRKLQNVFVFSVAALGLLAMEWLAFTVLGNSRQMMTEQASAELLRYAGSVGAYYFTLIFCIVQTELLAAFAALLLWRGLAPLFTRKERKPLPFWPWIVIFVAAAATELYFVSSGVSCHALLLAARESSDAALPELTAQFGVWCIKCLFGAEGVAAALVCLLRSLIHFWEYKQNVQI